MLPAASSSYLLLVASPSDKRVSCLGTDKQACGRFAGLACPSIEYYIYTCRIPRCMSSRDRKSECPPRFEAVLSTRGRPFRWLLPPPRLPASTVPGEGEHGGLLEGLLVSMLNRQDVCEPACLFQHMKKTLHPKAVRQIAASIYEQQVSPPIKCFENRNYLCLPRHFPRREVNGFARFFDQRVRLPRLNREGFARRPIG